MSSSKANSAAGVSAAWAVALAALLGLEGRPERRPHQAGHRTEPPYRRGR